MQLWSVWWSQWAPARGRLKSDDLQVPTERTTLGTMTMDGAKKNGRYLIGNNHNEQISSMRGINWSWAGKVWDAAAQSRAVIEICSQYSVCG